LRREILAQKILGRWDCHGSIQNNNLEINFLPRGQLIAKRNGEEFGGNYTIGTKTLTLSSQDSLQGELETFADNSFIMNMGQGYRMVCDRKS
jgi:hypothetical protein